MRGIGLVALLFAGAVSACRSTPLVDRPDALGPSVIVRHTIETDIEVPEEQSEVRAPGGQVASVTSAIEPPAGWTSQKGAERTGAAPGSAGDERGPAGASSTLRPAAGRATDAEFPESDTATSPKEAQDGAVATTSAPPTPRATIEPVEDVGARSRTSAGPWPWAALAVLLVVAWLVVVRRFRARSRLRSRRFDPDDAWAVFQTGLARRRTGGGG